jgi:hypothetical protein
MIVQDKVITEPSIPKVPPDTISGTFPVFSWLIIFHESTLIPLISNPSNP